MSKALNAVLSLFIFSAPAFAGSFSLNTYSVGTVPPQQAAPLPPPPSTVNPPGVTIAEYKTEETYTFESKAKPAMQARIKALRDAGVTTLGGRVVEVDRDYSFVIDYLPTVKAGTVLPPAVLVRTYKNGAAYWLEREAEEEMKACAANLRSARLTVLDSYVYEAARDNAFAVDYLVPNRLFPTREYDVKFERYTGGQFTFESRAEKAIPSYLSMFRQAGVPALRGRAVERPDGDYAVEVEYVAKSNRFGPRPRYSVSRYDSREEFTFEKDAKAAGKAALPRFSAAGAPGLSSVVRETGRDYSFSVDFLVENIYQYNGPVPSVAVQTYSSPEVFTFESEAKKAMEEKVRSFASAGFSVVGSAVSGEIRDYIYTIDYVVKAQQGGPVYPPPPYAPAY